MTYLTSKELKNLLKARTVIGHSGHRDLLAEDFGVIKEKVKEKLWEIVGTSPTKFVLITGIAEGADKLVSEVAVDLGIQVVFLAISKEGFPEFYQDDLERIEQIVDKSLVHTHWLRPDKNFPQQTPYEILRDWLVSHSTHLLALWDGVDTGKVGGTWQVVTHFNKIRKLKGPYWKLSIQRIFHHLLTPHLSNPFPYAKVYHGNAAFPIEKYKWESTNKTYHRRNPFSKNFSSKKKPTRKRPFVSSGIFLRFTLPLLVVMFVLLLGTAGYLDGREKNWFEFWNGVFFSANLITLDQSVFPEPYNLLTQIARLLGGSFTVIVFLIALYYASGKENFYRFLFFSFRVRKWCTEATSTVVYWISFKKFKPMWSRRFAVVVGLNEVSFDLVRDLRNPIDHLQRRSKVVILNPDPASIFIELAQNEGAWILTGIPTSSKSLLKTYFHLAEQVFVVTGSEEENVRCIMEMDQVISIKKKHKSEDWFVHIQDNKLKRLLQQSISARANYALTVFSHADNTARRMLAGFPELRGTPLCCSIAIVGFGPVGKSLALKSLQQLVFSKAPLPKIMVFYPESDAKAVEDFKQEYPYLFEKGQMDLDATFREVTDWTFFEGLDSESRFDRIQFHPLPLIPQQLTHSQSPLFENLPLYKKLKVFACLHSGLESASFLTAILPGMERVKLNDPTFDLQAFCFYNFPDEEEEAYLEQKLNALAPHIPVKCFGNFLYEFSCKAIQNKEADHLAKQVALWYYLLYDYGHRTVRTSMEIEQGFSNLITEIPELQEGYLPDNAPGSFSEILKLKITGLKHLWHKALSTDNLLEDMGCMMRHCWKSLSETDREGNRQAADHLWVKVTAYNKTWEISEQASEMNHFQTFWTPNEIEELGIIEHRRWNTMKILDGWRPFEGTDWKTYKETYKAQKLHNLLVPFKNLPETEQVKDYHQIEGIPFFIALLYKAQYGKHIMMN